MPHWPQFSSERFAGKSANGKWGDTVEEIDWSTGEILKALKQNGIDKKTLVVFMSDNGGAIRHGASNKPLKAGKGSTWEGGQRVPFLIRWPGTIPAGTASDEMVTSMDLLPTFAGLAGGKLDSNRKIDGKNIRDLLLAKPGAKSPHELFVYFHQGQLHGVRSGKWKMLFSRDDNSLGRPSGLFDLENDIGEKKNVLHLNRVVAKRLAKLAEPVRADLGDSLLKVKGSGVRPAGMVKNPKTLTQNKFPFEKVPNLFFVSHRLALAKRLGRMIPSASLFGLDNVVDVHITISSEEWAKLQPPADVRIDDEAVGKAFGDLIEDAMAGGIFAVKNPPAPAWPDTSVSITSTAGAMSRLTARR